MVCGLWIVDFGLWTCGLWVVGCGLWVVGCGLWIVDCGVWILDSIFGVGLKDKQIHLETKRNFFIKFSSLT